MQLKDQAEAGSGGNIVGRKRKCSHIRIIREQISKRAAETAQRDPHLKRLHHLWITMELKEYFGVRYFEEIPLEFERLCIDLVDSYRKTWSVAKEIGSLVSCANK